MKRVVNSIVVRVNGRAVKKQNNCTLATFEEAKAVTIDAVKKSEGKITDFKIVHEHCFSCRVDNNLLTVSFEIYNN